MLPDFGRAILDGVNVGVFTVDRDCNLLSWNRFMEQHSARPAHEILGRNLFQAFREIPRVWFERKVRSVFLLGNFGFVSWRQRPYVFPFPHNRPVTGGVTYMHQDCTLIPLRGESGAVDAVCITIVDATDAALLQQETENTAALLRNAMSELERSSVRDGLTGIHNRRSLDARLTDEFRRYSRYGTPFSVLLFDVDHFKKVNDGHGHLGGDQVLRELAARVDKVMRDTDTFGRYGGEEFLVLMPNTRGEQGLIAAERVRKLIAGSPIVFEGTRIDVTVSIGVCEVTPAMTSEQEVLQHADVALYACKAGGRNCTRLHGPPAVSTLRLASGDR